MSSDAGSSPWLRIENGSDHVVFDENTLPYKLLGPLDSAGCSVADKVRDRHNGNVFARKVFTLKRNNKGSMKEAFQNEVNNIHALQRNHHMIRLHATYTTPNKLALILSPIADDGDLDNYLDKYITLRDSYGTKKQRTFGTKASRLPMFSSIRVECSTRTSAIHSI
jgi:serine/threonine protein kinase